MSQISVFGQRHVLAPMRARWSEIVHAAAVDVLGLPPDKRFHRFFPMDPEDFPTPPGRSERYTIVEVRLFAGRTVATNINDGRAGVPCVRGTRIPRTSSAGHGLGDRRQDRGVLDGRGRLVVLALGDRTHGPAEDLARAGLGQPVDDEDVTEGGYRADLVPD